MDNNIEREFDDKFNKNLAKILLKYLIALLISIILLFFTILSFDRIRMFGGVFGSFSKALEVTGIIIYLVSLGITLAFHIGVITYILVKNARGEFWERQITSLDRKLDILNYTFKIFAILLFIMIFLFTPCTVKGDSMNPTFYENENIVCNNYCLSNPKKNDVIIFDARSSKYVVDDIFYIKRVVAVPGSKIRYDKDNGKLYIDDLEEETISNHSFENIINSLTEKEKMGIENISSTVLEFTVPSKRYLVFGDNRTNSLDSRYFGFIKRNQIFGKVTLRIFPINKFKWF